jgi:hypothetical protein
MAACIGEYESKALSFETAAAGAGKSSIDTKKALQINRQTDLPGIYATIHRIDC